MRNITFTERAAFGLLACLCGVVLCAAPAAAEDLRPGCYERIYSDDHLARHPQQVVWQIRLKVDGGTTAGTQAARLEVIAANQGHARRDDNHGRELTQGLSCETTRGVPLCRVECDGGALRVTKQDGGGLTFSTDYLMVGEQGPGCGGLMDLAEMPGQSVAYRLNRVPAAVCGRM